jgi:hypothetical protein
MTEQRFERELPMLGEISSEAAPGKASEALKAIGRATKKPTQRRAVDGGQNRGVGLVRLNCSSPSDTGNEDYRMRYLTWGRGFDFADPDVEEIHIRDVALALAALPRFGGHAGERYSVGQHSLLVCEIVCSELGRPDLARDALLHDAAEAFTGDIVRPLKRLLESRCDVLKTVELAVACALEFQYPTPAIVKEADQIALGAEVFRFFPKRQQIAARRPHVTVDRVLSPGRVEQLFLDRFYGLDAADAA